MAVGNEPVRVAVIAGSRRPGRRSRAVAEWVCREREVDGCELSVVDLEEVALPPLAEPSPAVFGRYEHDHTRRWSALIDRCDAFVLVTPEYNHSTSAVLKDALDHLYREWHDKAVAFVGYGVDGGVRAVEHLRGVAAELGMAGVGPSVALSIVDDFDDTGALVVRDRQHQMRARMLDGLRRWAVALRPLRADGPGRHEPPGGSGERPTLSTGADDSVARAVAEQLVARLQGGLDGGDADRYDSMFADDVLWGSPYGQVLRGYAPLNTAHRSMMTGPRTTPTAPPVAGRSRYDVVRTAMPTRDVVVTHVRRVAEGPAAPGMPEFSEMALYVLVRRGGQWWLAAGQNTPIRDKP